MGFEIKAYSNLKHDLENAIHDYTVKICKVSAVKDLPPHRRDQVELLQTAVAKLDLWAPKQPADEGAVLRHENEKARILSGFIYTVYSIIKGNKGPLNGSTFFPLLEETLGITTGDDRKGVKPNLVDSASEQALTSAAFGFYRALVYPKGDFTQPRLSKEQDPFSFQPYEFRAVVEDKMLNIWMTAYCKVVTEGRNAAIAVIKADEDKKNGKNSGWGLFGGSTTKKGDEQDSKEKESTATPTNP